MEPLILRLMQHMKFEAFTENGCALVARLRRPYDPDDVKPLQEDCEFLARSMPLSMLNIPGVPTLAKLGDEALETPWLILLHDGDVMTVPFNRYTGRI